MHLIELSALTASSPCAVCLGTFDGVHLGHQALLHATADIAHEKGLLPCAYTFDVPPAAVLGKSHAAVLTKMEEKAALMAACGVDTIIYSRFDRNVAAQSAEDFFNDLLLRQLNAHHVIIGFHYHFGCMARGDAALMRSFCERAGIGLTVVPPVRLADGTLVSSTSIRACLASGNRRGAEEMLNRPLSVREEALLGGREHE
ncbi:MAG: FAD synthetase family protein [Clostridia bacterium]|nr:FAD synthetase family protein [Clostridia bacterium]